MSWRYLDSPWRVRLLLTWRALWMQLPAVLLLHMGLDLALDPWSLPPVALAGAVLLPWLVWSGAAVAVMVHYHHSPYRSMLLAAASLLGGLSIDAVGLWLWPLLVAAGGLILAAPGPDNVALDWPQAEAGHEP